MVLNFVEKCKKYIKTREYYIYTYCYYKRPHGEIFILIPIVGKEDFLLCSIWTVDHTDITPNFSRVHSNLRDDENDMKR